MLDRALPPGTRLGSYTVVRLLGRGGMGAVYEARDERLGRSVALKVIDAAVADDTYRKRFEREGRAAAAVVHENVVRVFDVGEAGGRPFLAQELVAGGSLKARIAAEGKLPWAEACRLGAGVARGLGAVHAAGFVHRDVKPDNVLLGEDDTPKLADFGLVRRTEGASHASAALTGTAEIAGTFAYMAPEQADGAPSIGPAADLYALGATLHAALTGRPPFEGEGYALIKAHLLAKPRPPSARAPDVPRALDRLVLRLLAKDPAARGTAQAAERELLELGEADAPVAPPRIKVILLVVLVLLVTTGVLWRITAGAAPAPPPVAPPPAVPPPPPPRSAPQAPPPVASAPPAPAPIPACCSGFLTTPTTRLVGLFGRYRLRQGAAVGGVAVGPTGERVYSVGSDGALRIFAAVTGDDLAALREPDTPWPRSVAVAADERTALLGGDGAVEVWDLVSRRRTARVDVLPGRVIAVAYSADGGAAFCLTDLGEHRRFGLDGSTSARVTLVDAPREGERRVLGALAPDGRVVVVGPDEMVRLVDTARSKGNVILKDVKGISVLAWDPSSRLVALGVSGKGGVGLLGEDGEFDPFPEAHTGAVTALAATRGGFASADGKGGVIVWDPKSRRPVASRQLAPSPVRAIAFSANGTRLVTGAADGGVTVLERKESALEVVAEPSEGHRGPVTALGVAADGTLLVSGGVDATLRSWNLPRGELRREARGSDQILALALSSDGQRALVGTARGAVAAWDLATGMPTHEDTASHSRKGVKGVTCLGDFSKGMSAGEDGRLVGWNLASFRSGTVAEPSKVGDRAIHALATLPGSAGYALGLTDGWVALALGGADAIKLGKVHRGGVVRAVALLDDGSMVSGGEDGQLLRWKGAKDSQTIEHGRDSVYAVAVLPGGRVVSGSADGAIWLSDLRTGMVLDRIDLGSAVDVPAAFAVAPDGRSFFAGTGRGVILRFELVGP